MYNKTVGRFIGKVSDPSPMIGIIGQADLYRPPANSQNCDPGEPAFRSLTCDDLIDLRYLIGQMIAQFECYSGAE